MSDENKEVPIQALPVIKINKKKLIEELKKEVLKGIKQNEEPEVNEWELYGSQLDNEEILMSDYDHKAFLVKQRVKKDTEFPEDLLVKELQLSCLDPQLAYIYSLKITSAEELRSMGYKNLAKRRLVHLMSKLALLKSVEGFERLLQTGNVSTNAELQPAQGMQPVMVGQQEQSLKKPSFFNRFLRR